MVSGAEQLDLDTSLIIFRFGYSRSECVLLCMTLNVETVYRITRGINIICHFDTTTPVGAIFKII